jgi:TetR/AcrR family transcriptional regulator, transcriptional repressor for nem operon
MIEISDSNCYWWRPLRDEAKADTRSKILNAAYREIHLNGFQAASLNNILSHTGVTKGALYHHFPNKTELGYAVIEEVIAERVLQTFINPVVNSDNPVKDLINLMVMTGEAFTLEDVSLGCPLANLAQEMAPIDEGFRLRLNTIYQRWHEALADAITRAQQKELIIKDIDARQVSIMIVACLEGCLSAGKISQDIYQLQQCGAGLIQYLKLLLTTEGEIK